MVSKVWSDIFPFYLTIWICNEWLLSCEMIDVRSPTSRPTDMVVFTHMRSCISSGSQPYLIKVSVWMDGLLGRWHIHYVFVNGARRLCFLFDERMRFSVL